MLTNKQTNKQTKRITKLVLGALGTSMLFVGTVSADNQMINGTINKYAPNATNVIGINGTGNYLSGRASTIIGGKYHNSINADGTGIYRRYPDGANANPTMGLNSVIIAGDQNYSSGALSIVTGGHNNEAAGEGSGIYSGQGNVTKGKYSGVYGGSGNTTDTSAQAGAVFGGFNNTVTQSYGVVVGGANGTVNAQQATVVSGNGNTANQDWALAAGGEENTVNGQSSVIVGGTKNTTSGQKSVIVGGSNNSASWTEAVAVGGTGNTASGQDSVVLGGTNNHAIGMKATAIGGTKTSAMGIEATAIGGGVARGTHSIAIGVGAVNNGNNDYTVSFGHQAGDKNEMNTAYTTEGYNRLINVGYGINPHDAVTVDQLTTVSSADGTIQVTPIPNADYKQTDYSLSVTRGQLSFDGTDTVIATPDKNGTRDNSLATVGDVADVINKNTDNINKKLDNKANTNLDNLTAEGQGMIGDIAKEAVKPELNQLGRRINKLDNKINKVGAGAAALAGLHPLDFDPDDKFTIATAGGAYRNEQALAIGAFYRPNENTMLSMATTLGNNDNMVNIGASFKVGNTEHTRKLDAYKTAPISTVYVLEEKLADMTKRDEKQQKQIEEQQKQIEEQQKQIDMLLKHLQLS